MTSPRRYALLTPPQPAALSAFRLRGDAGLFDASVPAVGEPPRLLRMVGADAGLVWRDCDESLLFTPHGGAGVIRLTEEMLVRAGFARANEAVDESFAAGLSRYQRTALELLSTTHGGAMALLLRALEQSVPENFDARAFADAWPTVRRRLRRPTVALVGEPNSGKSTLFNALTGQGRAIVSDIPGTTRDVLHAIWSLPEGSEIELLDTAGYRDDSKASALENAGMEGGRCAANNADFRLLLASCESHAPRGHEYPCSSMLVVATKLDLGAHIPQWADIAVCALTRQGVENLERAVADKLFPRLPEGPLPLSEEMADEAAEPDFSRRWFTQ